MTWVAVNFWFYAGAGMVVFALPYAGPFGVVWLERDGEAGRYLDGTVAALKGLSVWAYLAMAVAFGATWSGVVGVLCGAAAWHVVVARRSGAIERWVQAEGGSLQIERRLAVRVRTLLALAVGVSVSFVALMVRLSFD